MMDRREALRVLAGSAAIHLTPRSRLLAMLRRARAMAEAQTAARTLNPHQFTTVRTMAELILPRTDTPGATDVGVAEFIDIVLTEWCEEQERGVFLNGLADVDSRSQTLFSKDFIEASARQQAEVLVALGKKMEQDARGDQERAPESQPEPDKSFYLMFRRLTLTAYYTSEAGATQELQFDMVPGRFDGCLQITATPAVKEGSSHQ